MKRKTILILLFLVLAIASCFYVYEEFLAPATVCIVNKSGSSMQNIVLSYPGGEILVEKLQEGKSKEVRLHGITTESGIFVEVESQKLGEIGYVGPYPSYTEIGIVKDDGVYKFEE